MEFISFLSGLILQHSGCGVFILDYIFPHIKPLERWIDSLPMMQDESEGWDDEQ